MPDVTVDIQVYCGNCGEGLCNQSSGGAGNVSVDPCEKCLEAARDDGYQDGYDEGDQVGYDRGVEDGKEESK